MRALYDELITVKLMSYSPFTEAIYAQRDNKRVTKSLSKDKKQA
jgi:hypothetical protein